MTDSAGGQTQDLISKLLFCSLGYNVNASPLKVFINGCSRDFLLFSPKIMLSKFFLTLEKCYTGNYAVSFRSDGDFWEFSGNQNHNPLPDLSNFGPPKN